MPPWMQLLMRLRNSRRWPIEGERWVRQQLLRWIALRETDEQVIRTLMRWPTDRPLILDNLAEKIAAAYGDLLFGENPDWTAASPNDQDRLEHIVGGWPDDLKEAEEKRASEGEVWWRITVNPALDRPVLTWHSRWDVVPLLYGTNVLAVAFVSVLPGGDRNTVFRHLEIHQDGEVHNVLFKGRRDALGMQIDLTRHLETQDLAPDWFHEQPMCAGRIVRRFGRRKEVGQSIYHGVWTMLLELHEARTIGRENMRLTAKKRAIVPASALRPRAGADQVPGRPDYVDRGDGTFTVRPRAMEFDAGEDVFVHDPLDTDEDGGGNGPFKVLEYTYDAEGLIAHKTDLVQDICMRCDIVPQFIGSGDFGSGNTGTALRVRLLPTTNAAEGQGRAWDGQAPEITRLAQLLDALSPALGGLGAGWSDAGTPPSFERSSPLPEDPNEQAMRHSTLKTADLISREQSIRERYPEWSDEQVTAEIERIDADVEATMPAPTFGGPPPPAPGG